MAKSSSKTWMPTVAGILLLIAGAIALLRGLGRMFIASFTERPLLGLGLEIAGGLQVVLAIIIIIGGIFAVQRKVWWLALTASVIATLHLLAAGIFSTLVGLIGILAIILLAVSK